MQVWRPLRRHHPSKQCKGRQGLAQSSTAISSITRPLALTTGRWRGHWVCRRAGVVAAHSWQLCGPQTAGSAAARHRAAARVGLRCRSMVALPARCAFLWIRCGCCLLIQRMLFGFKEQGRIWTAPLTAYSSHEFIGGTLGSYFISLIFVIAGGSIRRNGHAGQRKQGACTRPGFASSDATNSHPRCASSAAMVGIHCAAVC